MYNLYGLKAVKIHKSDIFIKIHTYATFFKVKKNFELQNTFS